MKRKLVKQGVNALTVTLPSQWTHKYGLKPGDEVNVHEQEKNLLISTEKNFEQESSVTIDSAKLNDVLLWTYIIAAYRKGADEIKVKYESQERIKLIQKVVDALLGLAVVDQKSEFCIIKDLSGMTENTEFDQILRRIFILLKNLSEETLTAIKTKNNSALNNMEYQDYSINKFSNFCLRLLSKKGHKDFHKTPIMHYIVSELENLGDEYVRLALDAVNKKLSKEVISAIEDTNKFFIMYYHFFYKFDNTDSMKLLDQRDKLMNKIEKLLKTKKAEDIKILYHLSKMVHI
ncbi:MAG: hypothetical protein KKA79_07455, partial [Nanoarchaeota archaeon]|nr:hypothetical protein [Nanoarchaeota archaeon]